MRKSKDRRDQGAASDVGGMQPGACASAVGAGTSKPGATVGPRTRVRKMRVCRPGKCCNVDKATRKRISDERWSRRFVGPAGWWPEVRNVSHYSAKVSAEELRKMVYNSLRCSRYYAASSQDEYYVKLSQQLLAEAKGLLRRLRSVQSAGAALRIESASDRETPSPDNTNSCCGERSGEDDGSASGERTDAALPAALSADDITNDGTKLVPPPAKTAAEGERALVVIYGGLVKAQVMCVRFWKNRGREAVMAKRVARARQCFRWMEQPRETARNCRNLLSEHTAVALGNFLLAEKGGLA